MQVIVHTRQRGNDNVAQEIASLHNDKTAFCPLTDKTIVIIHPPIGDPGKNSWIKKVGNLERGSSGGSERLAVTPPPRLRAANFFSL